MTNVLVRFRKQQNSQKGKEKAFIQRGNMNQQDGQRQSTRGKIFNGRYLMELEKIEKPGNQQK